MDRERERERECVRERETKEESERSPQTLTPSLPHHTSLSRSPACSLRRSPAALCQPRPTPCSRPRLLLKAAGRSSGAASPVLALALVSPPPAAMSSCSIPARKATVRKLYVLRQGKRVAESGRDRKANAERAPLWRRQIADPYSRISLFLSFSLSLSLFLLR